MIYTCTYNPAIDYKVEVDGFIEGDLNRTTFSKFVAGGKGINVSIVLKNLGVENKVTGFIGGFTGEFVKDSLKKTYGLETCFITVNELTRLNTKINNNGVETEVNALGPVVTEEELNRLLDFVQTMDQTDILIIGGSPARGKAGSYLELVKLLRKKHVEFVIDTNKKSLIETLPYQPLLVKPNIKELNELFECDIQSLEEIVRYSKKLIDMGAKNVIVSLGGEGSVFVNQETVYKAKPIIGDVKNTVGAGDSMVAGFVKSYVNGGTSLEHYKTAIAAGTATAFSYDLAQEDEVNELLGSIEVEEL